jgi:actin-related protein
MINKTKFLWKISSNLDIRPSLYNNILLIGGNCLFPNFKERL